MNLKLKSDVFQKWFSNQVTFLKPLAAFVGILYLGAVIPKVQEDGLQLVDLAITNAMVTAVFLYIANGIYDYLRKL
jgi:hypothetical protein